MRERVGEEAGAGGGRLDLMQIPPSVEPGPGLNLTSLSS